MPKIDIRRVRSLMAARGMKYDDLADAIGMSSVSVRRFLAGTTDPREPTVIRMAEALGTVPEVILVYRADKADPKTALIRVRYLVETYSEMWTAGDREKIAHRLLAQRGDGQ